MELKGVISRLPEGKNFGFIKSSEYDADLFFHREDFHGFWTDLIRDFRSGKVIEVEFEEGHSPKGPRAAHVKRLDFPN